MLLRVVYIFDKGEFGNLLLFFFFQAEDGIRDLVRSRGLGDVYKRQVQDGKEKDAQHENQKQGRDGFVGKYKDEEKRKKQQVRTVQITGNGHTAVRRFQAHQALHGVTRAKIIAKSKFRGAEGTKHNTRTPPGTPQILLQARNLRGDIGVGG